MRQLVKDYLNLIRLDRPIGIWLLFLPCVFGLVLMSKNNHVDFVYLICLFFIGSVFMRSAGCVVNDIWDRKFDAKVSRTKDRPIASGSISVKNAMIFLAILLFLAFLILLQFNYPTIILGFVTLVLVALYPLMKRLTYYPQIFLGLTFNLGILFSSTAIIGAISINAFLLYATSIIWTVIYDTIYAYQDIEDDLQIGIKSTAIKFQKNPRKILFLLTYANFLLLVLVGIFSHLQFVYYILISLGFFHLFYQVKSCDFSDGQDCLRKFKSNFWVGIIILMAIILG